LHIVSGRGVQVWVALLPAVRQGEVYSPSHLFRCPPDPARGEFLSVKVRALKAQLLAPEVVSQADEHMVYVLTSERTVCGKFGQRRSSTNLADPAAALLPLSLTRLSCLLALRFLHFQLIWSLVHGLVIVISRLPQRHIRPLALLEAWARLVWSMPLPPPWLVSGCGSMCGRGRRLVARNHHMIWSARGRKTRCWLATVCGIRGGCGFHPMSVPLCGAVSNRQRAPH